MKKLVVKINSYPKYECVIDTEAKLNPYKVYEVTMEHKNKINEFNNLSNALLYMSTRPAVRVL